MHDQTLMPGQSARSRDELVEHYRANVHMFDTYCRMSSSAKELGLPSVAAYPHPSTASLVLHELGKPATSTDDVMACWSYIERLNDEIDDQVGYVPTFLDYVARVFYSYSGTLPTVDEWRTWPEEERASTVTEIATAITTAEFAPHPSPRPVGVLATVVHLAIPAALAQLAETDQTRHLHAVDTDQNTG